MCSRFTLASFEDKCICRISELVWMFGEPESNSSNEGTVKVSNYLGVLHPVSLCGYIRASTDKGFHSVNSEVGTNITNCLCKQICRCW